MSNFVTEQMCETLACLQRVGTFDVEKASYLTYAGVAGIDPRRSEAAVGLIAGRILALRVFNKRMHETLTARA